jgi:hypothetical protein
VFATNEDKLPKPVFDFICCFADFPAFAFRFGAVASKRSGDGQNKSGGFGTC